MQYNEEHGITPTTIRKAVRDLITTAREVAETEKKLGKEPEDMNREELEEMIIKVEKQMRAAAAELNFEMAAELRDQMILLRQNLEDATDTDRRIRREKRSQEKIQKKHTYKSQNGSRHYNRGGKV